VPEIDPTRLPDTNSDIQDSEHKRGRKQGSKNKPRVDWASRKEAVFQRMTALAEQSAPPPAVGRLLQSQLESCDAELSRQQDDRVARLEQKLEQAKRKIAELENPAPPQQDLDELLERYEKKDFPKEPSPEEKARQEKAQAERDRQAEKDAEKIAADKLKIQEIKAAKEAEARAAEEKRQARIKELEELKESIYKARSTPGFGLMAANNPAFLRDGNAALKRIDAELWSLKHGEPPKPPTPDPTEQEFRHDQAEAAKDWAWGMTNNYQTTRPQHDSSRFRER
jgi:DNA repair exonuclease SbcCD ATPase subunit